MRAEGRRLRPPSRLRGPRLPAALPVKPALTGPGAPEGPGEGTPAVLRPHAAPPLSRCHRCGLAGAQVTPQRVGRAMRSGPRGPQGMPAAVTGTWGVLPGRGWRPRLPELPFVTRAAFLFSVVPGPGMGAAQTAWPCDGREGPRVPRQTRPRFGSSSWGAASSPAAAGTLSLFAAAPGPGSALRGSLAASTQMSPKFPKTCVIIRPFEQNRAVDRCLELGWGLLPPFPSVY